MRIVAQLIHGTVGQVPCMDTFEGAVMIADITGFTKLTEELSKKGPSGVELLTKCMNNFFSKVVLLPSFPSFNPLSEGSEEHLQTTAGGLVMSCCVRLVNCKGHEGHDPLYAG